MEKKEAVSGLLDQLQENDKNDDPENIVKRIEKQIREKAVESLKDTVKEAKLPKEEEERREKEIDSISEEERSWRRNRKAWIYYYKEFKEDKDIIFEEVDSNAFLFDCRSARLYIWDGKNNIFALFGVQNLLNSEYGASTQVNKSNDIQGTRIFYKGMELETARTDADCELFEYIDIKGGLGRKYINLSRRGFTEAGEKYFKEQIYQALIVTVKNVLKYLAKNYGDKLEQRILLYINYKCQKARLIQEKIESYKSEKIQNKQLTIEREVKKKLDVLHKEFFLDLEQQIMAIVMLSYYANRDENNELMQFGCMDKLAGMCPWMKILKQINDILNENETGLKKLLGHSSVFFEIKIYDETLYTELDNVKSSKAAQSSFVDIFSNQNQYAVISNRKSNFAEWSHTIINIQNPEDNVICYCNQLLEEKNPSIRKILEEKIDTWGDKILKNFRNRQAKDVPSDEDYKQQGIIKWLLHSVPTIAMLSSEDGKTRINVLSNKIPPFVYLNDNFKILILKRMRERYEQDKIMRFSTLAWQGREYISCCSLPFNVYFVKRGYLAVQGLKRVVFPFSGKELQEIFTVIENNDEIEFEQKLSHMLMGLNIYSYIGEHSKDIFEDEKSRSLLITKGRDFTEMIYSFVLNHEFSIHLSETEAWWRGMSKEALEKEIAQWQKTYKKFIEVCFFFQSEQVKELEVQGKTREESNNIIQSQLEKIAKLTASDEFKKIVVAWLFVSCCMENEISKHTKVQELKRGYYELMDRNIQGLNDKRERIIQYIEANACYPMDKERIEICYQLFEEEIWDLLERNEKRRYKELEKLLDEFGKELKYQLNAKEEEKKC